MDSNNDADFNDELAKLKAGAAFLAQAAAESPELAARFKSAMDEASATAQEREEQAQAQAKANALRVVNESVRQILTAAVESAPTEPDHEPEEEPEEEGS